MRIARQPVGYLINFGRKGQREGKCYILSDLHEKPPGSDGLEFVRRSMHRWRHFTAADHSARVLKWYGTGSKGTPHLLWKFLWDTLFRPRK